MDEFLWVALANSLKILSGAAQSLTEVIDEGLDNQGATVEMVKRAKILILCHCNKCEEEEVNRKQVFAYPDIVLHWVDANSRSLWFMGSRRDIGQVVEAAEDVLVALGLPKNSHRDTILKVGSFVCRCGHPGYHGSLSFEALVRFCLFLKISWLKIPCNSSFSMYAQSKCFVQGSSVFYTLNRTILSRSSDIT
jgi:hypothetical protein